MSSESQLSIAELIRRAVDKTYTEQDHLKLSKALEDSFGAWNRMEVDGEAYVERLRRGMARRLEDDR